MIDRADYRRVDLFRGLSPEAERILQSGATIRAFAPDTVLWRAGSQPAGLFVILEGEVRVVRGAGGRQHVVHTEATGGTLGDVALFHGQSFPATAIASRRTRCVVVSRDVLVAAMREDPALALALLERLAGRVRHLVERLDRLAAHSVRARLAAWLLDRHTHTHNTFTLGATQLQLAEELGTVREVIARSLRRLRDARIIQSSGRGRYAIVDIDGLRAVAAGADPAIGERDTQPPR